VKLSKALKLKNKLAGEIAQAQRLIAEANVVEGSNLPPHDVTKLYADLILRQTSLAALKGKIAVANGPISGKIFELAELKARIAFLRGLPTKDGAFFAEGSYRAEPKLVEYRATIKAAQVELDVKEISDKIEEIQDALDEFNATTEI
jgi:hypothetical protein